MTMKLRVDRMLADIAWPKLQSLEAPSFLSGDVILVAAGFEDRVTATLNSIQQDSLSKFTVIEFEYRPIIDLNRHSEISKICRDKGFIHKSIEYDRRNPSGVFCKVSESLPERVNRIFIDISGVSKLLIVQLVVGFFHASSRYPHVSVLYVEAKIYPPLEDDARNEIVNKSLDSSALLSFITAGVFDLAVVTELSSSNLNRASVRLIAFPSFSPEQLLSVRSSIQPTQMSLIHGVPPSAELMWRTSVISKLNHLDDGDGHQNIHTSTLSYGETLKALLDVYERWAEFNTLIISPTGSKMQTVAVGIFKAFVNDIQVVYPTPLNFTHPEAHTTGVGLTYELRLDDFIVLMSGTMRL